MLFILHLDFWRSDEVHLYFDWLPHELAYRIAWMVLAWAYLSFFCRYLWRTFDEPGDEPGDEPRTEEAASAEPDQAPSDRPGAATAADATVAETAARTVGDREANQ